MSPESREAHSDEVIAGIIAEFSQVFAFARTRWSRYAEEVHSELRGLGMMILQTVIRRGSITATELSQLMDMDKSVISRQLAQLRELGLIEATPDETDRRVMRLSATDEASSTIEALRSKSADAYHERFTDWSEEDLETLYRLLRRFNFSSPGVGGTDGGGADRVGADRVGANGGSGGGSANGVSGRDGNGRGDARS